MINPNIQGLTERPSPVGSSELLGDDSLVKSMRAFDRAVLSHLDDERNHTAELSERIVKLPLGYRIICPQNRISKAKAVGCPIDGHFHRRFIDYCRARKSSLNQCVRKALLRLDHALVVVGWHRDDVARRPNEKGERRG